MAFTLNSFSPSTIAHILLIGCILVGIKCDLDPYRQIDAILKDQDLYDRRVNPEGHGNVTKVFVTYYVTDMWDLNQKTMDCEIDCYLELLWIDPRLNFNTSVDSIYYIKLQGDREIAKLWLPRVYFPNAKDTKFQSVPYKAQLMLIGSSGYILYTARMTLTFSCPMHLERFPFDHQTCFLQLSPVIGDDMAIDWMEGLPAVNLGKNIQLPQFILEKTWGSFCKESRILDNDTVCLQANFKFKRRIGFHLINTYIPSTLLVIISWCSFWMEPSAVPGRVSLGITNLLAISAKASSLLTTDVEVSYVRAIDVWMIVCTTLIFLSLCEFVAAYYKWFLLSKATPTEGDVKEESLQLRPRSYNIFRRFSIDEWSRVIFPGSFIIFNCIYWPYYLQHQDDLSSDTTL